MAFEISSARANHIVITAVLVAHCHNFTCKRKTPDEILEDSQLTKSLTNILLTERMESLGPQDVPIKEMKDEIREEVKQAKEMIVQRKNAIASQCHSVP